MGGVLVIGVVGAVIKLVFKLILLPFLLLGFLLKLVLGLMLLPIIAAVGLVALAFVVIGGLFAVVVPLLPLVLAGLLVVWPLQVAGEAPPGGDAACVDGRRPAGPTPVPMELDSPGGTDATRAVRVRRRRRRAGAWLRRNDGRPDCNPTGRPSASNPHGTDSAGSPASGAPAVKTSARYICTGSSSRSPRRNAVVGLVGVATTSTVSSAASKSRVMSVRTCSAFT